MKRKITFLIAAALMLLTMMATTGTMWGQAAVNTTLWEETWTGGDANETPSAYGFEGTTVYGNATLTYAQSSTNTKLYAETLAGGTSPELLLSKSNQTWTISNIPTGQATEMSLTFLSNKTTFAVTSTTTGITISGSEKSWTISANNVTSFNLTIKNTGSSNARVDNILLKVTTAGGGSGDLEDSDLAITGTPVALNFDLYNNSSAQVIHYTTSSTGAVTVSASDYVTTSVNETAKTITVTPTAVTPSPQTITVSQTADATYSAGSVTFTVTITNTPPAFTVTLGDDSSTLTEASSGAGVTLPTRNSLNGYDFAGWSETNVNPETTTAPIIIAAGEYHPTANITLYPVYSKTIGGGGSQNANASVTIANYASAHNWTNGVAYQPLVMDDYVSVGGTISGNNFKYYTSDNTWRFYTDGSFTISTSNNATLTSFTLTIPSGTLTYNDNTITSNTPVNVNGSTATINCTANAKITAIAVSYTIPGTGTTYYWSSPVAATVETPAIVIAENPFYFSTTATITCATEGAAIKYSFDGANWSSYSAALTITETTTIYAKAIKDEIESTTAYITATKNLAVPTVTIDATNITNTDVFTGTAAGSLSASITYNEVAIEGATVTWSGDADAVATIDASTGAVTLVAAGSVTFTATYAGNGDYSEKTATYQMTVTNTDPNIPGSQNNPYTVAQARAAIDAGTGLTGVYATGIVSEIVTPYSSQYHNISYNISSDGLTTNDQLQAYRGKSYNGANFTSEDDIQVGDIVVVYGNLKKYNDIYEFDANNQLVSLIRKVATPTFSPIAGDVAAGTEVTIACATNGATIYYTTDGTDPTTSSNVYSEPILVNAAITIKAFAWKDGSPSSDIVTAEYTIAAPVATPTFSVSEGTYNFAQSVEIECTTEGATIYYTTDGNDPTTESTEYTEAIVVNETMTIKAIGAKAGLANSEVASATYTMNIPVINASNVNLAYDATNGSIAYTLTNEVEGGVLTAVRTEGDWLTVGEVSAESVALTCTANEGEADRTATVTLTYNYETHTVTKVVTVTQAHFIVDYATLPFEYDGNGLGELPAGLTQNGLTGKYDNSPKMKFDSTDDWLLLKINETPGTLTFDIKGNTFSDGTFKVQTSENGETYTDLATYTELGAVQHESFDNLGANVRYIKWIYTEKVNGNVGLGNIALAEYVAPVASITVTPDLIEAPATPVAPATAITGSLTLTLSNITITDLDQLGVDFCDANGNILSGSNTKPNWFDAEFELVNEEYKLNYTIAANDVTEQRIAYFKVYEVNTETYSDLVTVTQEALVASITVSPDLVEATAEETEGNLAITLTNIEITEVDDHFEVYFCNANGEIITDQNSKPNWLIGEVQLENSAFSLYYMIEENTTSEARTAYMKVYGLGDNLTTEAYSNLVTVTQEAGTAPEYTVTFSVIGTIDDNLTATGSSIDLPTTSARTPDGFAIYGWALQNSIEAVANPYVPTADVTLYALLQLENAPTASENYVKVTEDLTDWSGEYLIVYEDGNVAFDGSLTTLDVAQNTIAVSITNNTIEANTTTDASMFTITALSEGGYSIQSASGYYIGQTSNNNGMATSQETAYANTISINDNSATIVSGGAYLRYNNASNQNRFRYYKSSSYTGQQPIQLYRKVSETPVVFNNVTVYDDPLEPEPVMDDPIPETTCVVVGDGITLTLNNVNNGTAANLVVQEGGQLIHTSDVQATVQKSVAAYTAKDGDGWYMIATPVDNLPKTAVASTSDFDLFLYNEPNAMWYAHWDNPGFETLYRGKGYLYANAADVDLNYAGLMKATDAEFSVPLSYECDAYPDMKGFNLVGNPFTRNLKLGDMKLGEATLTQFYVVNPEHTGLVTIDNNSYEIKPGEGFFVQAKDENQTLEFNPSTKGLEDIRFIKIVAGNENGYDNAYINIGCGNTLRKTNIANLTSVYVMDQGLDYSAARVEELAGNMPVHFAPSEDGFFTITVEAKNLENINFMHLIDNIENTAINLLAEPTYTFKAGTSDNEDRFTLVFDFNNYLGVNENNLNDSFVYQSGDELILNGEGTLQVFDMMGRFVMSKEISGSERISTSTFETGVYVLRFVGETVMTQKIVIE